MNAVVSTGSTGRFGSTGSASRRYDYVIVGGGSAGCALANRLSADPGTSVLVLEAGRSDLRLDPFIHMPAALPYPIGNRLYDWKYESEPEPHMGGRKVYHARGKLLGGSSSINGMIFQRGNPLDFERWAADKGMESWDYAHCLPYFKRMENCLAGADAWRGASGPLVLERGPATSPLFGAFFEAVQQAGHPLTDDVNGYRQEGFAAFDRNVHRGRRLSAARAYLHPVMSRKNLRVETLAMVTGLVVEGERVTGVDYHRMGRGARRVMADEVILCGGAINSPQLLLLAGIGPKADLERLGIPVVADLPGVGSNLQDHLEVYIQYASKMPVSIGPWLKHRHKPRIGAEWLFLRAGVGSSNHFEAGGFIRSNDRVDYPNLMFHFLPDRDPVRRLATGRRARLPGAHRADVLRRTRHHQAEVAQPVRAPRAAVQLPVHRQRPPGVDRDGPRRAAHPQPAGVRGRSTPARSLPDPRWTPTRRSSTGWPMTPRPPCTRPARPGWASTTSRCSTR